MKQIRINPNATKKVVPAARPSNPSVRFTALVVARKTIIINGKYQ
jgi:hypothetical protein